MTLPARYRTLAIHAALVLTTLAVYAQVARFEFVGIDDLSYVAENPRVLGGLTAGNVAWAFTTSTETHWAPLTWLSFMLDAELGGADPRVFHLTNLALHVANTSLLFYVLALMTSCVWRSAFVAMLFAIHPLHVESVAWITERKDVLSALFWFLTMWAYAAYAARPGRLRYALVLLLFTLGLLSKSMLVTLPFVLLILDYWPLGRLQRDRSTGESLWRGGLVMEKVPLLAIGGAVSAVAMYGQMTSRTLGSLEQFPLGMRAANAVVSCAIYLEKMIWPTGLAVPYPYWPEELTLLRVTASILVVVGLSALAVITSRSRPYLMMGWLWYLITLVPVIGLVQAGTQARADRYTYLPLVGAFIMVTWGTGDLLASRIASSSRWRILAGASAAIVIVLLAGAARVQASHWRSTSDLFSRALEVTGPNAIAHNGLGLDLLGKGLLDDAIAHFKEALRIWPSYAEAHVNMAAALLRSGRTDEAVAHYREALLLRPGDSPILAHLGAALLQQGSVEEAVTRLGEASRLAPNDPFTHEQLGIALARQGKSEDAIGHLREAVRARPDEVEARVNLGIALLKEGRLAESEAEFVQALRIAPDDMRAHKNLGVVLARDGRIEDAIAHFSEAVRLDPADEGARKNLERARSMLGASR